MTRRPTALVIAAAFTAVALSGTQVNARQKNQNNTQTQSIDQHTIAGSYGPHYHQERPFAGRARVKRRAFTRHNGALSSRDCLHAGTKDLLAKLEARFGKVELVKTCVAGARMPNGDVSWHARNRAFDFNVPRGVDKRDVMLWLTANSPGVTISYRSMPRTVHTDTGTFHKVIYNAASHEAGDRAVAIWQERESRDAVFLSALPKAPLPAVEKPRSSEPPQPDWTTLIAAENDVPPAPIVAADRLAIFWRLQAYVESKDVVVHRNVTFSCPGGKPLPAGLTTMLRDAAAYWQTTVYVNSFYRSPAYNRKVGGARQSRHMRCEAADWRVAGVATGELRAWVVKNRHKWKVTGIGTYARHLHTDIGRAQLVEWNGGRKRYAKRHRHQRYATAG